MRMGAAGRGNGDPQATRDQAGADTAGRFRAHRDGRDDRQGDRLGSRAPDRPMRPVLSPRASAEPRSPSVAEPRQGPREVRGPLPPHPGRRIPGHQPRPVRADPPARPGPPQRLRGRRPGPGHLRLARRRHPQHPGIRERLPRARGRQPRAQLRSSRNIVTAAAALIAHNEDRADKTLWTGRSPGAGIEHLRTKSDHDEADTSPGSSPHSRTPRGRPPCSTGPTRSRASSRTRCAAP